MSKPAAILPTQSFGRFRLIRPLSAARFAERWLSLHEDDHSSHMVYRLDVLHDKLAQRRFLSAAEQCAQVRESHLLEIQHFSFDAVGRPCVVTPYLGNQEGLVTLRSLAELKGGRLSPLETERAVVHILEGLRFAHHNGGASNGPLTMDEMLVDRHGRVSIELYGLRRRMKGLPSGGAELAQDEVRSIAEIAYELLTGMPAEEPRIEVGRLVKKLDPAWEAWLDQGLSGIDGFQTVDEAISRLPSVEPVIREAKPLGPLGPVRSLLSRFRRPTRIDG